MYNKKTLFWHYLISIITLFFVTPIGSFSQETSPTDTKHQINISIDNIFAEKSDITYPYIFNSMDYKTLFPTAKTYDLFMQKPMVGLGYKYSFNNNGIRAKVNLGRKNTSEKKIDDDNSSSSINHFSNTAAYTSLLLNLGYERQMNFNKTRMFFGITSFMSYDESYTSTKTIYTYNSNTQYAETTENTSKKILIEWGYGFSPLVGVEYFLSDHLSLSTEIKCFVRWFQNENIKKSTYNGNDSSNGYKTDGNDVLLGPLGNLSFNIHF